MSGIHVNDKVNESYEVFIGVKAEEHDLRVAANELIGFGYERLIDMEHNDNVILVYTKRA